MTGFVINFTGFVLNMTRFDDNESNGMAFMTFWMSLVFKIIAMKDLGTDCFALFWFFVDWPSCI